MLAFRGIRTDGANEPRALPTQPEASQEGHSNLLAKRHCRVLALFDLTARGEAVLRYAAGIAVRDRSAMMAVHVMDDHPLFESDGPCGHFLPEERLFFTARVTARKLDLFLARNNAPWAESTVLYGKTNEALATLISRWKPDLIVVDAKAARHRAIAGGLASVPRSTRVLALERAERSRNAVAALENHGLRGGTRLDVGVGASARPAAQDPARRKQVARTVLLGIGTGILYWLMFANERALLDLSAKGHWYFILPLTIALVFSFVHGVFTAEFWDVLGVKANRKH